MEDVIYGKNVVIEALKSGRNLREILISKNKGGVTQILTLAKKNGVVFKFVDSQKIKKFGEKTGGVVAFCNFIETFDVFEILTSIKKNGRTPFFLICDGVKDPHNLGALIRTAYAVCVDCVILPKRRSAPINSTVLKASAGAANFVKISIVSNLAETIKKLKKEGVFIYCADLNGKNFYDVDLKGAIGLVVGSEEKGARSIVKKECDGILTIPMKNNIDSLNVSVAGAIIMYEILKQNSNLNI